MDEVITGLYISSLQDARNNELLQLNNIKFIISLGCSLQDSTTIENNATENNTKNENNSNEKNSMNSIKNINENTFEISNISFPNILDLPEEIILSICYITDKLIDYKLSNNENVLVHCVYGQSRSAAIIISYLMNYYYNRNENKNENINNKRMKTEMKSELKNENKIENINEIKNEIKSKLKMKNETKNEFKSEMKIENENINELTNLEKSLILLKLKHSNICINCGFLNQLNLLNQTNYYCIIIRLLIHSNFINKTKYILNNINNNNNIIKLNELNLFINNIFKYPLSILSIKNPYKKYYCKKCNILLFDSFNIINNNNNININYQLLLDTYLDGFWINYPKLSQKNNNKITLNEILNEKYNNYFLIEHTEWITQQINENNNYFALKCPNNNCCIEIGNINRNGLLICDNYVSIDAIYINKLLIIEKNSKISKNINENIKELRVFTPRDQGADLE